MAPNTKSLPKLDSHTTRTRRPKKAARNASSNAPNTSIPAECQLAGAQAAADKKLLVNQMDTGNNAKKNKMPRQRLSDCCTVGVHQ